MVEQILDDLNDYVKLNYIVNRINSKLSRNNRATFNFVNNCRYDLFGVSDDEVLIIEGNDYDKLTQLYESYVSKLEKLNAKIFEAMFKLSNEDKMSLRDILENRQRINEEKAFEERVRYEQIVNLIKQKVLEKKNAELYDLCLLSKDSYSTCYEYQVVGEVYSNLKSYLSGLIGSYMKK